MNKQTLRRAHPWFERSELKVLQSWLAGNVAASTSTSQHAHVDSSVCVVTGFAGAGKTVLVDQLLRRLELAGPRSENALAAIKSTSLFVFCTVTENGAARSDWTSTQSQESRESGSSSLPPSHNATDFANIIQRLLSDDGKADLVVLDGFEHAIELDAKNENFGCIRHAALREFVLSRMHDTHPSSKLIITTRIPVRDLEDARYEGRPYFQLHVGAVSAAAAEKVLAGEYKTLGKAELNRMALSTGCNMQMLELAAFQAAGSALPPARRRTDFLRSLLQRETRSQPTTLGLPRRRRVEALQARFDIASKFYQTLLEGLGIIDALHELSKYRLGIERGKLLACNDADAYELLESLGLLESLAAERSGALCVAPLVRYWIRHQWPQPTTQSLHRASHLIEANRRGQNQEDAIENDFYVALDTNDLPAGLDEATVRVEDFCWLRNDYARVIRMHHALESAQSRASRISTLPNQSELLDFDPRLEIAFGHSLLKTGFIVDAIKLLERVMRHSPDNACSAGLRICDGYINLGQFDAARTILARLQPNQPWQHACLRSYDEYLAHLAGARALERSQAVTLHMSPSHQVEVAVGKASPGTLQLNKFSLVPPLSEVISLADRAAYEQALVYELVSRARTSQLQLDAVRWLASVTTENRDPRAQDAGTWSPWFVRQARLICAEHACTANDFREVERLGRSVWNWAIQHEAPELICASLAVRAHSAAESDSLGHVRNLSGVSAAIACLDDALDRAREFRLVPLAAELALQRGRLFLAAGDTARAERDIIAIESQGTDYSLSGDLGETARPSAFCSLQAKVLRSQLNLLKAARILRSPTRFTVSDDSSTSLVKWLGEHRLMRDVRRLWMHAEALQLVQVAETDLKDCRNQLQKVAPGTDALLNDTLKHLEQGRLTTYPLENYLQPPAQPDSASIVRKLLGSVRPKGANVKELRGKVDVGIITVRHDEYSAVVERIGPTRAVRGGHYGYEHALVPLEDGSGQTVSVVVTSTVLQGNNVAQAVANHLISDLEPAWLFLVGIAGGVADPECGLGDVVVASYVNDFSASEARANGKRTFQVTGGAMHPDVMAFLGTRLVSSYRSFLELGGFLSDATLSNHPPVVLQDDRNFYGSDESKKETRQSLQARFPSGRRSGPPVFLPKISASANTLVKDPSLIKEWKKAARQIAAVEMELGGVYSAATSRRAALPVLAIRGISDVIGFKRDPNWTAYACHSAAGLAWAILRSGAIDFSTSRANHALGQK